MTHIIVKCLKSKFNYKFLFASHVTRNVIHRQAHWMLEKLQTTESISEMTKQISENETRELWIFFSSFCALILQLNYVYVLSRRGLYVMCAHEEHYVWQINNKVNSPSGNVRHSFNVKIQYILKLLRILKLYSLCREQLKQDSHMNDFIMHMIRMLLALQSCCSEFLMEIRFQ